MTALLEASDIRVGYSGIPVIHGVSFKVNSGETVCMVGSNGAGKSTILRSLMGSLPVASGKILFQDKPIQGSRTEAIVRMGMVYVPEERMLFSPFSVEDNLLLGAYLPKARPESWKTWRRSTNFFHDFVSGESRRPRPCPAANSKCLQSAVA